jgi:hypothetical protein
VRERTHLVPRDVNTSEGTHDGHVADESPTEPPAPSVSESLQQELRERVATSPYPLLYYTGVGLIAVSEIIFLVAAMLLTYLAVTRGESVSNPLDIVHAFSGPLILLVSAAVSTVFGFIVLRFAGAADRLVIPRNDRDVLLRMVEGRNRTGIRLYTDLVALSGTTGFFRKIGVSGLPLATIFLSVVFGLLALLTSADESLRQTFADLAKLTLGAFLGSYVQRQQGESDLSPEELRANFQTSEPPLNSDQRSRLATPQQEESPRRE